jgi:L,D-transpeptidase ErfK/SrfK
MNNFLNIKLIKSIYNYIKWPFVVVLLLFIALFVSYWVQTTSIVLSNKFQFTNVKADSITISIEADKLNTNIARLNKRLDTFIPKNHFLIVNSTENEFALYKGKELISKGICSTGSYLLLEKSEKEQWLFKTPKGELKVRSKTTNPVWKKPDWAFIEEGLPVPSPNHDSRFEYGVLGDYALYLGQGYMIHGTLWQRYLGLPITHGCIRMGDNDLKLVYEKLSVGSKVYIY